MGSLVEVANVPENWCDSNDTNFAMEQFEFCFNQS